jgi:NAD(P)-dependent dehydrogenase (short-subunit alcohol dehydrogenase family)
VTDFDLTGRVALVTGATKGIGFGIARQMLRAGARVALTSRTAEDCARVADELNDEFGTGRAWGIAADLADLATVRPLVGSALGRWGRIDVLVANAALTGGHGHVETASLDRFAATLQTNIVGNFALAREVVPQMAARRNGSIVFITSIAAATPMPANVAYASSKAGLTSVALSLAAAYAGNGVRVNCVQPGLIRSHSSEAVWTDEARLASVTGTIPLGRIGEAEEVGAACVFLASSAGAYITGAVILVDGGRAALSSVTARPQ